MKQTYIYLCENKKTKERLWLLQPRKGWKIIEKRYYSFEESGIIFKASRTIRNTNYFG